MLLRALTDDKKICPPPWLPENTHYMVLMGSSAYGVSNDLSDMDIYGFCIPPKDIVFPHTIGHLEGFGQSPPKFDVWTEHHIKSQDGKKEYDFSIHSIIKYLGLVMENNPNMIDSLFVPDNCVMFITKIGKMVRDRRKEFLHKGSMQKFKGYAYAQIGRYRGGAPGTKLGGIRLAMLESGLEFEQFTEALKEGKLTAGDQNQTAKMVKDIEGLNARNIATVKEGIDLKAMYHVVRLVNEAVQILMEGDLDIQRGNEQLKSIRRGEWTADQIFEYFEAKEKVLEELYITSKLQHRPDEKSLKNLLWDCLEEQFGSLRKLEVEAGDPRLLDDLKALVRRYETN